MPEQTDSGIELKLRWDDASALPTLYANQVYITHAGGEFFVIFGEVQVPILLNVTPEEFSRHAFVTVKPVARLVMTPEGMRAIVDAMTRNLSQFDRRVQNSKEEEGT